MMEPKQLLSGLGDLPIEVLVYIFSLLPTSRDIVRLGYVSRKMRSISETSSLWRNFLWPWYDRHEGRSVNAVLKIVCCHQQQWECCNLTKISFGICLSGDDVWKVAELKYLQKLEIFWINSIPTKPIIAACSKLEKLVLTEWIGSDQIPGYDYLYEWVHAGFKPLYLTVINPRSLNATLLTTSWSKLNSQIPAGYTAHFKACCTKWH